NSAPSRSPQPHSGLRRGHRPCPGGGPDTAHHGSGKDGEGSRRNVCRGPGEGATWRDERNSTGRPGGTESPTALRRGHRLVGSREDGAPTVSETASAAAGVPASTTGRLGDARPVHSPAGQGPARAFAAEVQTLRRNPPADQSAETLIHPVAASPIRSSRAAF